MAPAGSQGPAPLEAGSLSTVQCRILGSRAGKLVSQAPQVTLPSTKICEPWQFKLPFQTACNAIFLWLFMPVTHSSVHWEEMRTDGKRAQGSLWRVADRRLSFSCHYVSSGILCCTWITQKNLNCYNLYPATDEGKHATWKDQEQEVTAGRAATQCAEHSGAHRAPRTPRLVCEQPGFAGTEPDLNSFFIVEKEVLVGPQCQGRTGF